MFLYRGLGHRAFGDPVALGEKSGAPYSIGIADLNRDGQPDLVVGRQQALGTVFFNRTTRGEKFTFTETPWGDGQGAVYGVALGDLDGDGWPDIAAARSDAPNAIWFSAPARK